jgi:hypothetical protein
LFSPLRDQRRVQALPAQQGALALLVQRLVLLEDPGLVVRRTPARATGPLRHLGVRVTLSSTPPAWARASKECSTIVPTEAITRVADATVADEFGARHDALAEHFSPEEILEIIGIVINMNVWTRLKLAECATPGLAEQAMS